MCHTPPSPPHPLHTPYSSLPSPSLPPLCCPSIREHDETLLLALAGVHCPDPELRARLNHTFIRRSLRKHK